MISYREALQILNSEIVPLAGRACGADEWLGGVTTDTVTSRLDVPPFANAAMDGFALRAADTRGATAETPTELEVWGTVAAGDPASDAPAPDGAAEIMTGALLPRNCDAVIPIERVDVINEGGVTKIKVAEPVVAGRNVRRAGEDFKAGDPVVGPATLIEPQHVMALAATGAQSILLRPAPRVAVITTGTELTTEAVGHQSGKIQDANGPYLGAVVRRSGATLVDQRRTTDQIDEIEQAIAASAENSDLIVTTGGVSAGRFDLIPEIVTAMGGDILFHKIRVRPGKPVLMSRLPNGTLLIGLPGNPVAAAVCMRFIALPAMRCLSGLPAEKYHAAITLNRIAKRSEFCFFGKARAGVDSAGIIQAELLPGQESFKIAPLAAANCWGIVAEGTAQIAAGDRIEVAPLYPNLFLQ